MTPPAPGAPDLTLLVIASAAIAAGVTAGIVAWAVRVVRRRLLARRLRREAWLTLFGIDRALKRGWTTEAEMRYRDGASDPILGKGTLMGDGEDDE